MNRNIIPFLTRYDDDIHPDLGKVWLHDTAIVSVISFSFLWHKEVKRATYGTDKFIGTVRVTTRVVSITDIFCMFGTIYHFRVDPARDEPGIDHWEIIIAVTWISTVMILSLPFRELDIPAMSGDIKSCIKDVCPEPKIWSYWVIPSDPRTSNSIHIDSGDGWIIGWLNYWRFGWLTGGLVSRVVRVGSFSFSVFSRSYLSESHLIVELSFEDLIFFVDHFLFLHLY